ncbi:MmcQ/YjbR family DNA-binding protein [Nonomuraea sp. NPDC052265]|uniref:MmcQ/YjbR family DNA-binding protein n=1 Tax=Nonomuraea sp. NPDC052265 TaxID=3364374 RepID=UPI0037CABCA9
MVTEDEVRALALALPETAGKLMYGTPAFYVRGRWFARITQEGGVLVVPVGGEELKHELIAAAPGTYFTTSHYDGHAVVLVRLAAVAAGEVAELLTDAWRSRAPKRVVAAFDG